jgi:hypothetical protein
LYFIKVAENLHTLVVGQASIALDNCNSGGGGGGGGDGGGCDDDDDYDDDDDDDDDDTKRFQQKIMLAMGAESHGF